MRGRWSAVLYSLFIINFSQNCFSCLFKDSKGNSYNLSRLKHRPLQTDKTEINGESYVLHFSLCQPLFQNFYFPTSSSSHIKPANPWGIIVRTNKLHDPTLIYFENLSLAAGEKENSLTFKLESLRSSCNSSPDLIFISLICSEEEKGPTLEVTSKSNCLFGVKWHTTLGCPIKYNLQNDCALKFYSYSFDLMPLHNLKYYKTGFLNDFKKPEIYLNFCGPVNFKDCYSNSYGKISVCIISNNKTYSFPQEFFNPTYDEKKSVLTLKPNHTVLLHGSPSIEINLKCNHNAYHSFPVASTKRHSFKVSFETYVACISKASQLEVLDEENGLRYNLPQITSKIETKNYTFLLNTSSQFGGFGISRNDFDIFSLGSLKTLKIENGLLNLIYTLGSLKNGVTCSSKITFACSKETIGPTLVSELVGQKYCQFEFVVNGSVACPIMASRGCILHDQEFGYNYNFMGTDSFKIEHNEMVFKINLCKNFQAGESCNGNNDTSVCLIKKNQDIIIGKRSSQFLTLNKGLLKFELTGEPCTSKVSFAAFIKAICDYRAPLDSKPVFEESLSSDCVYSFSWKTKAACPEEMTFDCLVNSTNGKIMDLNPLRRTSSNYKIQANDSSLFLLNFCGSLWYGENETCRRDSAACLVENGKGKIIGSLDNKKVVIDDSGEVSFIFEMPLFETCPNGLIKGTKIKFQCDTSDKDPEYVGFKDCNYSFLWKTHHACFAQNQSTVSAANVVEQKTDLSLIIPTLRTNSSHFIPETSTAIQTEPFEDINLAIARRRQRFKFEVPEGVQSEFKQLNKGEVPHSNYSIKSHDTLASNPLDVKKIPTINSTSIFLNIHRQAKFPGETCLTNFPCLTVGDNKSINLNYTFLEKVPFIRESKTESECDKINRESFVSSELFCHSPCQGDLCIKKRNSWVSGGFLQKVSLYNQESKRSVIDLNRGGRCNDQEDYSSQIELKCSDNHSEINTEIWRWSLKEYNCKFTVMLISPLFCIARSASSSSNRVVIIVSVVIGAILSIIIPLCLCYFCRSRIKCQRKRTVSQTQIPLVRQVTLTD